MNILTLSILLIIMMSVVSIVAYKYYNSDDSEDYAQEYSGYRPKCSQTYRGFSMDQSDDVLQKDRCKFCKGYNNIQYEPYCPHNCRQYGVSQCDQGKIL